MNSSQLPQLTHRHKPLSVNLKKDLLRSIKCGHAWLFSDAVDRPQAPTGTAARLLDRQGKTVASGIYCPQHPISFRICRTRPPWELDDSWLIGQANRAIALRERLIEDKTTGYRLVAGEGDGIPGLIIDRYADTAVIKLDGGAPERFYNVLGIAKWLAERLNLSSVVHRPRGRGNSGQCILGQLPYQGVTFLENGIRFTADVLCGQKTGFFLDQRDNRALVQTLSQGLDVLNLFSFSGGFSVAAGVGGAAQVTSIDLAPAAIDACHMHWQLNRLSESQHQAVVADCFEYLQSSVDAGRQWQLVICDPPSFAPSQLAVDKAVSAYAKLAQMSASVVCQAGMLALASCSSHVDAKQFTQANFLGFGRAKRTARLLADRSLPPDHPTPLAMPELRYLKFQLFQLD